MHTVRSRFWFICAAAAGSMKHEFAGYIWNSISSKMNRGQCSDEKTWLDASTLPAACSEWIGSFISQLKLSFVHHFERRGSLALAVFMWVFLTKILSRWARVSADFTESINKVGSFSIARIEVVRYHLLQVVENGKIVVTSMIVNIMYNSYNSMNECETNHNRNHCNKHYTKSSFHFSRKQRDVSLIKRTLSPFIWCIVRRKIHWLPMKPHRSMFCLRRASIHTVRSKR